MNAKLVHAEPKDRRLFSYDYSKSNITFKMLSDTFVSDAFTDEYIEQWMQWETKADQRINPYGVPFIFTLQIRCKYPVLISAQTGKGKNYFITHKLREYARNQGKSILYISNRVALDYQQKQELAELTGEKYNLNKQDDSLEVCERFSNVTVITYHKLIKLFQTELPSWFDNFDYVVIDECHFFYSDAYFNSYTGYLLEQIAHRFQNSVRIYMSATFDDVLEPIRYWEVQAHSKETAGAHVPGYDKDTLIEKSFDEEEFDQNVFAYEFPRDFSNYQCFYFSELEQISEKISSSDRAEKWIIFVTSKAEGKQLCKALNSFTENSGPEIAEYIDSLSRNDDDFKAQWIWNQLKKNGKFDCRVLVTTSVLDNGFSIKDPDVKNIVICSDDKTEFLQELGRLRIKKGDKVNLFIRKLDKKANARRKQVYERNLHFFKIFFGEKDSAPLGTDETYLKDGDPCNAIKGLWNEREDSRRRLVHLVTQPNGTLKPKANLMARWRTILLGKQIEHYEELLAQDERLAPALYKAQWLTSKEIDSSKFAEYLQDHDLDIQASDQAIKDLIKFLCEEGESGKKLEKDSDSIKEFSRKFQELYVRAYPDDKSVNSGKGRKPWNMSAINNHLEKIEDCEYVFKLVSQSDSKSENGKPIYVLQRKNRAGVKE